MTVIQKKADNPIAHLTPEDVEMLGKELDEIRQQVLDSRGATDAAYIRKVIASQRYLELGSRAVLLFSLFPPAWIVGTAGLGVAKILENMEIGHNVLHGQWDWMRDPKIHSTTWEWDNATPAEQWKHSHNELHHTYTNVIGKDNDLGYGIMRVDEDQPWEPFHLGQPLWNFVNMLFFEYGIAAYDLELRGNLAKGTTKTPEFKENSRKVLRKIRRQATKDYVVHPLLSGPSFFHTLTANVVANMIRNVWSHSIIMCGHFPEGVETFERRSIEGETRGEWYLRQMLGSANITGSKAVHVDVGQPVPPDRAPPVPRPAVEPVRRGGAPGAGAVREVRPDVLRAPPPAAGLLRVAPGLPALHAERLARDHDRAQPAEPAQAALRDGQGWAPGPPGRAGPDGPAGQALRGPADSRRRLTSGGASDAPVAQTTARYDVPGRRRESGHAGQVVQSWAVGLTRLPGGRSSLRP